MSDVAVPDERRGRRSAFSSGLRFSLVELAVVLLYACFGAAALKSGGTLAHLFVQTTIVLALAFVVAVLVAKRTARAFAIGFLVGAVGYGLPLFYLGSTEFDPFAGQSPASKIVAPLWHALDPQKYVADSTGKVVPNHEIRSVWVGDPSGARGEFQEQWSYDGSKVQVVERPPRGDFMLAAHAFLLAATGYLLGKLGAVLYRRRIEDETARTVVAADRSAGL